MEHGSTGRGLGQEAKGTIVTSLELMQSVHVHGIHQVKWGVASVCPTKAPRHLADAVRGQIDSEGWHRAKLRVLEFSGGGRCRVCIPTHAPIEEDSCPCGSKKSLTWVIGEEGEHCDESDVGHAHPSYSIYITTPLAVTTVTAT